MSVQGPEVLDVDPDAGGGSRRPMVAGLAAGLWALLVGVALASILVMLAWAVSPNSAGQPASAWRAAGIVWLGAHHVPLEVGGRPLTLLPLGALLFGLLLNRRGGRWAGRLLPSTTPGEAATVVLASAALYGSGGAGVAWLSASPGTGAGTMSAFLWTGAVALAGTTWGISREAELVRRARSRVSDAAWRTLIGGLAAVIGLFAVGAALVTVSLARNAGEVGQVLGDLEPGPVGGLALTVLGVLCLPTLDIWAMALVVGPGFGLGSANGLTAFGGEVQSLPALPVLAAIPTTTPGWGPLLMLAPVLLGALAGRIRWGRDLPTPTGVAVAGAGLAGVVAGSTAVLMILASGALGGQRLATVGPSVLPVAAAAAGLTLLGFLAEAGFQSLRLTWELHRAEQRRLRSAAGPAETVDLTAAEVRSVADDGTGDEGGAVDDLGMVEDDGTDVEESGSRTDSGSPTGHVDAGRAAAEGSRT